MRAFLALPLPEAIRAQLAAVARALAGKGDLRFTAPAQLHVTLKFLGEIDAAQAGALCSSLAAQRWPMPRLQLAGLGQFPPRGPARVVWAGLAGDLAELGTIAADCERAAAAIGVPPEDRPFAAHVTLARCRSPRGASTLQAALRELGKDVRSESFQAAAVVLQQSELAPGGSIYTERARWPLG